MAITGGKIRLFTPIAFADLKVSIGDVYTSVAGDGSVGVGQAAICTLHDSVAVGNSAQTFGGTSTAVGAQTQAHGDFSTAVGNGSRTYGIECLAIGSVAYSGPTTNRTISIGAGASASAGNDSIVIGTSAHSLLADQTIVVGNLSEAVSLNGISIGNEAYSDGPNDVVVGPSASTTDGSLGNNVVLGYNASVDSTVTPSTNSIAIGPLSYVSDSDSVAIGSSASAPGPYCIVIGRQAKSGLLGSQNIVLGDQSSVTDDGAYVQNVVIGPYASVVGTFCIVMGNNSSAGRNTPALTPVTQSVVIGAGAAHTLSNYSITIGVSSLTRGDYDIAVGANSGSGPGSLGSNIVVGNAAYIDSSVTPSSDSIAIGSTSLVSNSHAIAVGDHTTISGQYSIALGGNSSVAADFGIALGASATVNGNLGIAIGFGAIAGASEIVFSSAAAGGVSKFEVVSNVVGNPDLFKLDTSTIVNNHDSAMYLLYKDATGTVVMAPVTVDGVTGALTVPV
jgi:trimeric autotransporter adhesin